MGRRNRKKKNIIGKITKVFIVLFVLGLITFGILTVFNISIEEKFNELTGKIIGSNKKEVINALVCGINDNMTDTIIYVRYEVKTGKVGMLSIPRDTSISGSKPTASSGNKINSIYRGNHINELVKEVENLINVKIDYYLFFDSKMLIEMVDAIGGVEVNVPMRMKYDDPTQNLHINLFAGTQKLNGSQAEQFVRFRKNNDGTGYAGGDIERTRVQQEFIKSFISQVLSTKNVGKIKDLIQIALENTQTNVTLKEALRYVSDIKKVNMDNIITYTAPGKFYDATTPYWVSFWILDEEETQRIINEEFTTSETE